MRSERRSRVSSAGILLIISSRRRASSSTLCCSAFCTEARRSRSIRAWALRWSRKEPTANTSSATSTKTTMAMSVSIVLNSSNSGSGSHFHLRLKQVAAQAAAGGCEPVGEFGDNSGSTESSLDPSVLVDPNSLKHKNLLHGDDVTLHAGHFRDGNHLAGAVSHARNLHDGVYGRSDLVAHSPFG